MKQNRTLIFFFSFCAILFGFAPIAANATSTPVIRISEIAWAGSSTSNADEWVELVNMSDQAIDISGWSLAGASSTPIVFPAGSQIDSHTTFLIANYDNTHASSTLNTKPQIITTVVSLPNDKLALTLTKPDGVVVDSAGNGGAVFAGKSGGTGSVSDGRYRSMERIDASADGATKAAWADADVSTGLKENVLDQGTPGVLNAHLQTQLIANAPTVSVPQAEPVAIDETPIPSTAPEPVVLEEPEAICKDVVIDVILASITEQTTAIPDNASASQGQAQGQPLQTQPVIVEENNVSTTTETPTTMAVSVAAPQGTLRISEIYPHPATGESEWVELENDSMYPVVTNGWSILDASNAATVLPNGAIPPGSFLIIENPKGKLNNDGDSVILKNADGSLVESVLYNVDLGSVPVEGESLVRVNANTLAISITPTKNASNMHTPRPAKITTSTSTSTSTTSNNIGVTNTEPAATNTEVETTTPPAQTVTTIVATSQGQAQDQPLQTQPVPIIKTIRLSEFYPNTGGFDATDEFIEIENTGDQSVSLEAWTLTDAGGTTFTFADNATIAAHTFKAFLRPETKLSLNNDGDTITLTAPDASVVDTQTYAQTKTKFAYAFANNVWQWTTTSTPNEPNLVSGNSNPIPATPPSEPTTSATTKPSNGAITSSLLTIAEAKERTDGTRVKVRGTVTALPNTFNTQTMYIQDATGGIQIFKSDCLFPTLIEGQSITVTGVLSHVNGEARVKVMNQTSLAVGSIVEAITPNASVSEDDSSIGSLITIAGTITSKSGTRLALDVDGESWNVDLAKTNTAVYRPGTDVQVSGILSKSRTGNILKARSEQDVTPLPKDVIEESAPNMTSLQSTEPKQTLAIVLIILTSLAFLGLKLRPHLYALTQSYGRKTPLRPRS